MKLMFVNVYPAGTMARYQLSAYVLKGYLEKYYDGTDNLSVEVLNYSNKTQISKISQRILDSNPDLIGYSCYIWNIEEILKIIKNVKEKITAAHVLGGPEIAIEWISSLPDPTIGDFYVIGEGERTLLHLVRYLEAKKISNDVEFPKGIARWENDNLNYLPDLEFIEDLDEIPSVYLDNVIEDRLYARQQAFMETQRGCRWRCEYCVYPKNLPSLNYYSLRRVFDEIDYLIVEKKITALRIFDAMFTFNSERAKKIVKHFVELRNRQDIKLPWIYWEFTYQQIDEEFIELTAALKYRSNINNSDAVKPQDRPQLYSDILKDYTVINVMGIQSFNKQALKAVARPGIHKGQLDNFMSLVKKHNIVLKIDLILGLPFETFASYFEGLEYFLPYFMHTDHILNIHRLQVLPGSKMEQMCDTYEIEYSRRAPHLVFSTQTFSVEEIIYASRLSGLLFRVLNSPLRSLFFKAKECSNGSFLELLEAMLKSLTASEKLRGTQLVLSDHVDDDYWNDEIYKEIPSQWLTNFLEDYGTC